ncbi:MAG TPA: class I SAM-dependent methyltransferase [Vicinamibacterales bacterium]|nr:class I SAM-dependent methyltransferase [Vicinamibacterales bacterium]
MDKTRATGERFGHGWTAGGVPPPATAPGKYHLDVMQTAVDAPPFQGLILDAGCGDGVDLATTGLTSGCRAVGVELSGGGVIASASRIASIDRAHLVRGSVLSLPFGSATFDGAYSYGVVHHTIDPELAVREIARVLKPRAPLLIYVYEEFDRRSVPWRVALSAVNAVRQPISAMSPAAIRRVCAMLAPFVYATCTIPSRHFGWAKNFPYPATQNGDMKSLIPDLYDRFAAPIEKRYTENSARRLVEQAGLRVLTIANVRGWIVLSEKT